MADPKTLWLIVVNIATGLLVLSAVVAIAIGLVSELVERIKKRRSISRELDHDMEELFHSKPTHK